MQFLTPRAPIKGEFPYRTGGSRGSFYGALRCCVTTDIGIESVSVNAVAAEDARHFDEVLRYMDYISDGMRSSLKHEATKSGKQLCCVRIEVTDIRFQPTSENAGQKFLEDMMFVLGSSFPRQLLELGSSSRPKYFELVPPLHKDWLTSDVIALARRIHTNLALDGLPMLYDALLEAGCDDPLVMEHLRTCPDHSPSCWVTEMICAAAT